mmetsp:Transcript_12044/g.31223  ORF Transcript_12044/g.31223 Transcript_12044/m.31223 type:complete len:217 (+) Transcript_12044:1583-2233(+)
MPWLISSITRKGEEERPVRASRYITVATLRSPPDCSHELSTLSSPPPFLKATHSSSAHLATFSSFRILTSPEKPRRVMWSLNFAEMRRTISASFSSQTSDSFSRFTSNCAISPSSSATFFSSASMLSSRCEYSSRMFCSPPICTDIIITRMRPPSSSIFSSSSTFPPGNSASLVLISSVSFPVSFSASSFLRLSRSLSSSKISFNFLSVSSFCCSS